MGSYPLKVLLPVYYYYFFSFLFKSCFLIFDHLSGLNKVHYYGLSEKVEFCFFSSVSIANSTPLNTSIFFWQLKTGMTPTSFRRSLVVNCFSDEVIIKTQSTLQLYNKMLKALAHLIRCSKGNQRNRSWGGEGRGREGKAEKKNINREKKYFCTVVDLFVKYYSKWEDSELKLLRIKF